MELITLDQEVERKAVFYERQKNRVWMFRQARKFLSICESRDRETYIHSLMVGILSEMVAVDLFLDGGPALAGGLIHDCGKLDIAPEVLHRPVFTNDDYAVVKKHTIYGAERMRRSIFLSFIAGTHHLEGFNGHGVDFNEVLAKLTPHTRWYFLAIRDIVAVVDYLDSAMRRQTLPLDGTGQVAGLENRLRLKFTGKERTITAALACSKALFDQ